MEEQFKDKIAPVKWLWCIINNLQKFDNKPEYILELVKKFRTLKEHYILDSFRNIIEAIDKEYKQYGKFPDVEKLKIDFRDIRAIVISNDKFSMQIYEALIKYIDQEIIRQRLSEKILDPDNPDIEDIRRLSEDMNKFADNSKGLINLPSQEKIINSYSGNLTNTIRSGICALDRYISSFDARSINVIACPSGHGKTVLALNIAYNNLIEGKSVIYLSFELGYDKIYNCFSCIHGYEKDKKIPISSYNKGILTSEGEEIRKELIKEILQESLTVIDTSAIERIVSFDELLRALTQLGETQKADLIIIDNVDGLARYCKSSGTNMTEINNMVSKLESFAQCYCETGTTILLLSQINREGVKKIKNGKTPDYTFISTYSDVYQKARTVLIGCKDEDNSEIMFITPVKSTFKELKEKEIKIGVKFEYVKTINDAWFKDKPFKNPSLENNTEKETIEAENSKGNKEEESTTEVIDIGLDISELLED